MKHQNVFWGTILVGFGSLLLLDRLDVLYFNWWSMGKLWPFLLVLWGVSILPVKGGIKLVLALMVAALSIVAYSHFDSGIEKDASNNKNWKIHKNWKDDNETKAQFFSEPFNPELEMVHLQMDAGAGSFYLSGTTAELLIAENSSQASEFDFKVEEKGVVSKVFISQRSDIKFGKHNKGNDLRLMLNPEPVWSFDFNIGAADFDFDFSDYKVESIDIDGGAASIKLTLGVLQEKTDISINAGASSIRIVVPESAGCRLEGTTVLSSRNLEGFTRIDKGLYETEGFDQASQKLHIKIDAAVSSFTILRK